MAMILQLPGLGRYGKSDARQYWVLKGGLISALYFIVQHTGSSGKLLYLQQLFKESCTAQQISLINSWSVPSSFPLVI